MLCHLPRAGYDIADKQQIKYDSFLVMYCTDCKIVAEYGTKNISLALRI